MSEVFDLVILGGGPGGYVCAIRAAQKGLKVACVEKRDWLGGTCLNEGCIPSKVLLDRSNMYSLAANKFAGYGIDIGKPKVNIATMMKGKDQVVSGLAKGIEFLFSKNGIKRFKGEGKIDSAGQVSVKSEEAGPIVLKAKNIVVATGSAVSKLPGVEIDGKTVLSSKEALSMEKVPKSMVVIGGGVIGLELGSVWSRLGAKVTVVEFLDRVVPGIDIEVAKALQKALSNQGIDFRLSTKVKKVDAGNSSAKIVVSPGDAIESEKVLLAVGRSSCTKDLGISLDLDEHGRIKVDERFESSTKGIFAIGDVIDGPMLAHKAEEEGCALVDFLTGGKPQVGFIPSVVYTHPEVACVGLSEDVVKSRGIEYGIGKFPFSANSRARVMGDTEGFVKVITERATDTILGVHIIGPQAGTLIGEALVAMEYGASSEDIALMCHSHPDLNEAIKEACLAAHFKPIHG